MTERFSRRSEEEDAEGEVDADDHLLVPRVVRFPPPPCWPKQHQGAQRQAGATEHDE
jgi:hypothetical protein